MCYITESAIDHWNDSVGEYRCEKCKNDVTSVDTLRFCEYSEDEDSQEMEMDVCEDCKYDIYHDKKLVVF